MKIYVTKNLNKLSEVIESCNAPVYMVMDNGQELALKQDTDAIVLFRHLCSYHNSQQIQLKLFDPSDAQRVFSYLVNA